MLVYFREIIDADLINKINSDMVKTQGEKKENERGKNKKLE